MLIHLASEKNQSQKIKEEKYIQKGINIDRRTNTYISQSTYHSHDRETRL